MVGDAALVLDPLRGDGVGFALRGALLAQAVLAAIARGDSRAVSTRHYAARLTQAFVSHLGGCAAHYRAARCAEIWRRDIAIMEARAAESVRRVRPLALALHGRDLVPAP